MPLSYSHNITPELGDFTLGQLSNIPRLPHLPRAEPDTGAYAVPCVLN